MLFVCHPKILHKHCLQFLLGVKMVPRETESNAYYGMLWYFLEWSIHEACNNSKTYPCANLRVQYLIMLTQKGHDWTIFSITGLKIQSLKKSTRHENPFSFTSRKNISVKNFTSTLGTRNLNAGLCRPLNLFLFCFFFFVFCLEKDFFSF